MATFNTLSSQKFGSLRSTDRSALLFERFLLEPLVDALAPSSYSHLSTYFSSNYDDTFSALDCLSKQTLIFDGSTASRPQNVLTSLLSRCDYAEVEFLSKSLVLEIASEVVDLVANSTATVNKGITLRCLACIGGSPYTLVVVLENEARREVRRALLVPGAKILLKSYKVPHFYTKGFLSKNVTAAWVSADVRNVLFLGGFSRVTVETVFNTAEDKVIDSFICCQNDRVKQLLRGKGDSQVTYNALLDILHTKLQFVPEKMAYTEYLRLLDCSSEGDAVSEPPPKTTLFDSSESSADGTPGFLPPPSPNTASERPLCTQKHPSLATPQENWHCHATGNSRTHPLGNQQPAAPVLPETHVDTSVYSISD